MITPQNSSGLLPSLPKETFDKLLMEIQASLQQVEATIMQREVPFLALLAAYPASPGRVLEIGAFKGASTIVLSRAARAAGDECIWTVDPFTSPSETDPDLAGGSGYPEFLSNLEKTGEGPFVRVFQGFSRDLAKQWNQPIRLLWIDGDHTYRGAQQDFDSFSPFLSDGAIIAFHDVLATQPGPCRVFAHEVLLSPEFGPCGLSGSIGWAQHVKRPEVAARYFPQKLKLYSALCPHAGACALGLRMPRLGKLRYNFLRNAYRQAPSSTEFLSSLAP
ncbi:class I SAM-dependent methyltransferase [Acidithiobacillus sulfuriphilus]|uniref:Class I SAM-dependent methyltransferase n=2 Tax=Acidithiobacillus sulfuriphilus TaxID=1867749 RepID=A0A3M8SAN2_9PROT|nr:class I SAM-dependent methyltransferase [Acidithiobacillus sulfuriphilus]